MVIATSEISLNLFYNYKLINASYLGVLISELVGSDHLEERSWGRSLHLDFLQERLLRCEAVLIVPREAVLEPLPRNVLEGSGVLHASSLVMCEYDRVSDDSYIA